MRFGRYHREIRFRLQGLGASDWIGEGRKLIDELLDRVQNGRLLHLSRSKVYADGTRITAQWDGTLPIVTIVTTRRREIRQEISQFVGFVLWPRTDALPDGVDVDRPQIVLEPRDSGSKWTTYYDHETVEGWPDVTNRKRTYAALYPEGLRYFGNVDWRGLESDPKGQMSCSWYGMYARYWGRLPEGAVQRYVFARGQKLLDTSTYVPASPVVGIDWPVRGAAFRRIGGALWLYVMHVTEDAHALIRYPVNDADQPESLSLGDGAELVWSDTLAATYTPGWFFNGSCTQASAIVSEPFTVIAGTEFEEGARLYTLNIEGDSASIDSVALAEFTFKVVDHNTVFTDERVSEVIGTRVHLTGDCDGDPCDVSVPQNLEAVECVNLNNIGVDGATDVLGPPVGQLIRYVNQRGGSGTQESIAAVDYDGNRRVFAVVRLSDLHISETLTTAGSLTAEGSGSIGDCCAIEEASWSSSGAITNDTNQQIRARVEISLDGGPYIELQRALSTLVTVEVIDASFEWESIAGVGSSISGSVSYSNDISGSSASYKKRFPMFCDLRDRLLALVAIESSGSYGDAAAATYSCENDDCMVATNPFPPPDLYCPYPTGFSSFPSPTRSTDYRTRSEFRGRSNLASTDYSDGRPGEGVLFDWSPFDPSLIVPYITESFDVDEETHPHYTGYTLMELAFTPEGIDGSNSYSALTLEDQTAALINGVWLSADDVGVWSHAKPGYDGEQFCGVMFLNSGTVQQLSGYTGFNDNAAGAGYWPGFLLTER